MGVPATAAEPRSTTSAYSKSGRSATEASEVNASSTPTIRLSARAGLTTPLNSPMSTDATPDASSTCGSEPWCSNAAGPRRVASGSATHSWMPSNAPA